jgi:hypothetical protein
MGAAATFILVTCDDLHLLRRGVGSDGLFLN